MTVKELMDKLSTLPPELNVLVFNEDDWDWAHINELECHPSHESVSQGKGKSWRTPSGVLIHGGSSYDDGAPC